MATDYETKSASAYYASWGFEGGVSSADLFDAITGSGVSVQSTVKRSGTYALELDRSAATACRVRVGGTGGFTGIWQFYLRFATKPTSRERIFHMAHSAGAPVITLYYDGSDDRLELQDTAAAGTEVVGPTLAVDTWYFLQFRWSAVSGSITTYWYVDGVAQPTFTVSDSGPSYLDTISWGTTDTSGSAYKAYIDDAIAWVDSDTPLDVIWPPSSSSVVPLLPDAMGTSNNPTDFNTDLGALDSNSWQQVDDLPLSGGTDYIAQITANGASYAEVEFAEYGGSDTVVGASLYYGFENSAAGDTTAICQFFDDSSQLGGFATANGNGARKYSQLAKRGPEGHAAWTTANTDGLKIRFGYANDVTPNPRLHAAVVELALANPPEDNDGWMGLGWGEGQERWSYA